MGTIYDMLRKVEEMGRQIHDLSSKTVNIEPDSDGMIDKECPKEVCKNYFKIHEEDWKNKVKDETVYCPFCRNISKASEYIPKDQKEIIGNDIRNSLLNYWHTETPIPEVFLLKSRKEFELKIECEKCQTRFSVIGAAYFCPCCGFNSIEKTAETSIEKIKLIIGNLDSLKKILEENTNKDQAQIAINLLVENSLTNCIATLQSFCEVKYNKLSSKAAPFNVFQNIEKGNNLWIDLKGKGYSDWIPNNDYKKLVIHSQRRHLLEHKGGMVDAMYLQKTNDNTYNVGDRIVVKEQDVLELINLISKLFDSINKL